MEQILKDKERTIGKMEAKITSSKQQKPAYTLPKGDLIDEMIGQYIN